jgi:putative membrane protein
MARAFAGAALAVKFSGTPGAARGFLADIAGDTIMDQPDRTPNALRGALAGLAAGLAASWTMNLFQNAVQKLSPDQGSGDDEPATEKAADRMSQAAIGAPVSKEAKPAAGQALHYGFGALLGIGYGMAAEYWPAVTAGRGTVFGIGSAALFDEAAVPAAGLGEAPWRSPLSTHLYTFASHLIFGGSAEAMRKLVRAAI